MAGIVQLSCLGKWGRFGNQLFQYAFARAYAERIKATLQTPPWVGQTIFGLNDPPISDPLPVVKHPDGQSDIDLYGWFMEPRSIRSYNVAQCRDWFRVIPALEAMYPSLPYDYVAAHLRRGDFVGQEDKLCIIKKESYEKAIFDLGIPATRVVWVSEESGNPMIKDFLTLMRAKTLFMANSTFSYWAGYLGGNKVYQPLSQGLSGWVDVEFKEGISLVHKWMKHGPK